MSDDDIIIRASAYLDDELDQHERAAAEADPSVMATVDQMRSLQSQMAAVSIPLSASQIDDNIAAAFSAARSASSESDAEFSGSTPVINQPGRTNRQGRSAKGGGSSRSGIPRFLGVAAAIVGIGVAGVVIINSLGSNSDSAGDASSAATEAAAAADSTAAQAAAETTAAPTSDSLATGSADTADSDDMASDATMADSGVAATSPASDGADSDAPMSEATASLDNSAGAASTVIDAPAAGAEEPLPVLGGEGEFRDFARWLLTEFSLADLPIPVGNTCVALDEAGSELLIIAEAIFEDPSSGVSTPVYIAIRVDRASAPPAFDVFGVSQADCSVIVFTPSVVGG